MNGPAPKTCSPAPPPRTLRLADGFDAADFARALGAIADPALSQLVKENDSRSVYRVHADAGAIYVKHYRRRGWLMRTLTPSRSQREWDFARHLSASGVPTAPMLACCRWDHQEWLISRAVEPATPADQWHQEQLAADDVASARRISHAAAALGELVGRMHRAGVLHGDLHCGNVLVRTDTPRPQVVLLDLHRMHRRASLSRRQMTANLAQLYYDRFNYTRLVDRLRFLRHYLRASGAAGTAAGWAGMVEDFAARHARRQLAQRDARIFARNRYFAPLSPGHGWRGHVVLQSKRRCSHSHAALLSFTRDDWAKALADPASLFAGEGVEVVKDSRTSLVVRRRLQVGPHELDVFIKRARRKHAWKVLIDCFRPSRAIRAFRLGHILLGRRLATALPLGALERRIGPLLVDNILITEAVRAPQLHRFLEVNLAAGRPDASLSDHQRHLLCQQVLGQLGRLVQRLHDNRLAHRDLKASNLLVHWQSPGPVELVLVDLDGLKQVGLLTSAHRFQGLMRLNVSLLECPAVGHAGRLRMLLGYLRRPGQRRLDFKPYWRVLEDWSARKLRHQIRSRRARQRHVRRPGL